MKKIFRSCILIILISIVGLSNAAPIKTLGVLLFPGFELLDATGPLEMFGHLPNKLKIILIAESNKPVYAIPGVALLPTANFENAPPLDIVLIPGSQNIQQNFSDKRLLKWIKERSINTPLILTVCTGSVLLAKTGLLDHRRATTNKMAFDWAVQQRPEVRWLKHARWVDDGNIVSSSGVAAGIDMSLHIIARLYGTALSKKIANTTEYVWNQNPHHDPFSKK